MRIFGGEVEPRVLLDIFLVGIAKLFLDLRICLHNGLGWPVSGPIFLVIHTTRFVPDFLLL